MFCTRLQNVSKRGNSQCCAAEIKTQGPADAPDRPLFCAATFFEGQLEGTKPRACVWQPAMNMLDRVKALRATSQGETTSPFRVMFYSHDTFGLGHLRRSRALAWAITASDPGMSAIILTGSPVAGRFTFPERVDHMRLPGVTKLSDGTYVSQTLGLDIDETTAIRSGIIQSAVEQYRPDLLVVDKEPGGFRGELLPTLEWIAREGNMRCVLGLRDVLDEENALAVEWARKGSVEATEKFYDEIWVLSLIHI